MKSKGISIAVYSGDIPSTTFIENLINVLSEDGFEIFLFGKKKRYVRYNENVKLFPTPESNYRLIFFIAKEGIKLLFKNRNLFLKSVKLISNKNGNLKSKIRNFGFIFPVLNNQPDIFHIQWAKTINLHPELFELLSCKIALSLRGAHINYSPLNDPELKKSYLKYFPVIDGFHAVSEAIARESLKYGAEENKISVIHSSVKNELFEIEVLKSTKKDELKIISIGRHHWKKGYHYALDAMKILSSEKIKFKYTIIAQGEIPEEILYLMNVYELHDNVEILKGMNFNELIRKMSESDLLLLPSVEEGIANVVLEAMAAGVLVITTDCGGMNEVINDEINGYIVDVRDPNAIAEKVKEHLSSESHKTDLMIKNARQLIKSDFSVAKQKSDFGRFYNSLIEK